MAHRSVQLYLYANLPGTGWRHCRAPPKPIVVTESWHEFTRGRPAAEDIRLGPVNAIISCR
jgi:hypothetical protein